MTLALLAAALTAFADLTNDQVAIRFEGGEKTLWTLSARGTDASLRVAPPVFEIDGRDVVAAGGATTRAPSSRVGCPANVDEYAFETAVRGQEGLRLRTVFRFAKDSPVVRFRYELLADDGRTFRLTKRANRDNLTYLATDLAAWPKRTEVRMSEFCAFSHAHRLFERTVTDAEFENRLPFMGPILAAEGAGSTVLLAYEHGSQSPDAFVQFCGAEPSRLSVRATKGNYWRGRTVTASCPYETIWFDAALVKGGTDDVAAAFRTHLLKTCSPNAASRKPWIFYNTWAMQERDYWWRGSRKYLHTMNEKDIFGEIDAAHEMGIDVFVIDTGWFEKTGDWRVSRERFPHGLEPVAAKLRGYGMKLGLWFNPLAAACTSDVMKRNRRNVMTRRGKEFPPVEIWETEKSQNLCLVSDYWKDFADELIRLHRELGVSYFKWDAVEQYWCDDPGHRHGDASVPDVEREMCAAFEQVRYMGKAIDRLCAACPEAIVDFDVTEGGRTVGLAFLASGKYFASNNGPYYPNIDHPFDWSKPAHWVNVYVYPGPARARVARGPLDMDKWIPSVLFLTHFLPDAPRSSQVINLASLVLGQNGIWGELRRVSPEDRRFFAEALAAYKTVRDDITAASPVRVGRIGGSPEIHEKLANGGRGAVVLFSNEGGEHTYVTQSRVAPVLWKAGDVTVETDAKGRAILRAKFPSWEGGAAVVFFGEPSIGKLASHEYVIRPER